MTLKAAIFDWDGTITDSNEVKTQAFIDIFANSGLQTKTYILNYQKTHGGISRFDKYRHYMQTFLNRQPTETELRQFGTIYAQLCHQKLLQTPFIPGAVSTLKQLSAADIPIFIVTGSPAEEIRSLANERGILHFFKEIYGSPQNKTVHLAQILTQNHFQSNDVIFFGDALADYTAATANQIPFIGVCSADTTSPFPPDTKIVTQIKLDL